MKRKLKQILSPALALIMLIAVIPTSDLGMSAQAASYSSDWRYWSQAASDIQNMRSYGCWVVAQSKLIYDANINRSSSFNPDVYYWWEVNNGYIDGNFYQTNGSYSPVAYAKQNGKNLEYLGFWAADDNQLWYNINAGYFTIVKVSNGGHYTYIANDLSKEKGQIYCYDSWSDYTPSKPRLLSYYSVRNGGYVYKMNAATHTHSYTSNITTQPTCTANGVKTFTCSCGSSYTESVAALGHNYNSTYTIDIQPTCTTTGSKSQHCSRCSTKKNITVISANGHNYTSAVTTNPTCTAKGVKTFTCSICGNSYTEEIHANGHSYDEWTTLEEATCTEKGQKFRSCNICNAIEYGEIEKINHNFSSEWTVDAEATCMSVGSKSHHCNVCGEMSDITEIPMVDHEFNTEWSVDEEATCSKSGLKSHHCKNCDAKKDVTKVAATGHNYSGWKVSEKATCIEDGELVKTCSSCGKQETSTLAATGEHKYITVTTAKATASKNGTKTTKCSVCGKIKGTSNIYKIKSVTLSNTSYTYNGNIKKPTVTVKDSKGNTLKKGTDYTVKYSSGRKNVGKYTVTVTFKGKYSGTKKLTFKIKPKSTSIYKVTAGKKKFTAKWYTRSEQVSGYQLQYSRYSSMKNASTKTYSGTSKNSRIVSNLKAKTKYYVRVRTYKNVKISGRTYKYYSSWSSIKSIKTK